MVFLWIMIEAKKATLPNIHATLPKSTWESRAKDHRKQINEVLTPYLQKKRHQHKDPVLDFLFEYYAFRPSHLRRWSPGAGILFEDATVESAPAISEFTLVDDGVFLNAAHFPANRKSSAGWILELLEKSLDKKPSFGCFGMHEWAMVYKADRVRHNYLSLRMDKEELAAFVESRPLLCTHFDAFRFFTHDAKPMNKFELSQQNFAETEQPGCLHTNMDLYKWAFKLFPWISSKSIREAFFLAVDTRRIDMKASPYDLRERGLEPIKIETKEGRLKYARRQKEIYERSVPIRKQIIEEYQELIAHF